MCYDRKSHQQHGRYVRYVCGSFNFNFSQTSLLYPCFVVFLLLLLFLLCFCWVFFAVLLCVFAVVLKAQNINLRLTRVNLPEKDPGPSEKETKHMSEDKETN